MSESLHFIHVGDSHLMADDPQGRSVDRLQAMVEHVNHLVADGVALDFVVHTGDLADDADHPEADAHNTLRGIRTLAGLAVPWYLLNGNHDRVTFMRQAASADLGQGQIVASNWPGIDSISRTGIDLLFINANPETPHPPSIDAEVTGYIDSELLSKVGEALKRASGRLAIFLHYPPLKQEAAWAIPPRGGMALHALLKPHAGRIAGVFAGHVHRSIHHLADGVLYVSVPPIARHFMLWPNASHGFGTEPGAGLHYVTIDTTGTRVQHHTVDVG